MNKLPTNWKEVKLGDIIDIIMGQSPKSQFYNKDKEGMPFLQGSSTFGHLYPSFEVYSNDIKKIAVNGSVLMSVRAPVGDLNMANTDICIGRGLCSINGKNKSLNRYIFYLLNYYKAKIVNIQTGTVFGAISKDNILNFKVSIPQSEDEQKRIASILSSFDDKIELNNKTNKILEEMAQTIFEEWFINFNFPNANGKPYKKSGGEMINSELGEIPKGWKIDIISNLFNVTIGKTPPRKEIECFSKNYKDIKWVSISDMGNSGLFIVDTSEYLTPEAIKKYNVNVVPKNTVILSFKLTIGRVSITSEDMTTNEAIAHFNSDNNFINEYLYFYLKNFNYRVLGNTSSIAEAINSKIIKSIKIIIPKDDILNKYHNIVFDMFKKIRNNQIENQKLSGIRDSLLPKLMAGEIRIDKNFETIHF